MMLFKRLSIFITVLIAIVISVYGSTTITNITITNTFPQLNDTLVCSWYIETTPPPVDLDGEFGWYRSRGNKTWIRQTDYDETISVPVENSVVTREINMSDFYIDTSSTAAHYLFNGNVLSDDQSCYGSNGKEIVNITYTAGQIGQAASFDGLYSRVLVGDVSKIRNIWDDGGTLAVWIYAGTDGEGGFGRIYDKLENLFSVSNEAENKVKLNFNYEFTRLSGGWKTTDTEVTLGTWTHVVLTYNSSNNVSAPIIYVNNLLVGVSEIQTPEGTRIADTANSLSIGSDIGQTRTFNGSIDDLRFYDVVLSEDERNAIYNAGSGTEADNVTADWICEIVIDNGTTTIGKNSSVKHVENFTVMLGEENFVRLDHFARRWWGWPFYADVLNATVEMIVCNVDNCNSTRNASIEVGIPDGIYKWNQSGDFGGNDSVDLSYNLNQIILNGSGCTTNGSIRIDNTCYIPITFYADYGIINYTTNEVWQVAAAYDFNISQMNISPSMPQLNDTLDCSYYIAAGAGDFDLDVNISWYRNIGNSTWITNSTYNYNITNITKNTQLTTTSGAGSIDIENIYPQKSEWMCSVFVSSYFDSVSQNTSKIIPTLAENLTILLGQETLNIDSGNRRWWRWFNYSNILNATILIESNNAVNATIEIGMPDGGYEWSGNGTINEYTNNFASNMNSIVLNGTGCTTNQSLRIGDYCYIPVTFRGEGGDLDYMIFESWEPGNDFWFSLSNISILSVEFPATTDVTNCTFNVSAGTSAFDLNATVSWYRRVGGSWLYESVYDYVYENVTKNVVITTTVTTGGLAPAEDGYDWKCRVTLNDMFYSTYIESDTVHIEDIQLLLLNETITFHSSVVRWWSWPIYAHVYNASLILTGNYSMQDCYQETANVSTSCGGLDTGVYGLANNYFYSNYTIPNNTVRAIWQVKHGYNGSSSLLYNISTGNSNNLSICYENSSTVLQLRLYSNFDVGVADSYPQCLNYTTWINVGTFSSATGGGSASGIDVSGYKMFDGDYDTGLTFTALGGDTWQTCGSGDCFYSQIYEEAVFWGIGEYPSNVTMEIGTVDGVPEWNWSGIFNTTDTTDDFAINLNNIIANGTCNTNSSYISGLNCLIPITFYSDTPGNVTYQQNTSSANQTFLNVSVRNVKTLVTLTGYNISVYNENRSYNITNSTVWNYFILLPETYEINVSLPGYADYNEDHTMLAAGGPVTLVIDLDFLAQFNLFDERTLEAFNINGTNATSFLLFCPDATYTTSVNSTLFTLPINCNYNKFKFVLDYGVTSYYRTFILDPDEVLNYTIYLIDLLTTESIYNSFTIDDLLNDYDNVRIYIKKVIGDEEPQITADFIDVENKIGAYLIRNHEYIIEVHSDNFPIRVMGAYSADLEGDKVLRLYDITVYPQPSGFANSVTWSTYYDNATNTAYAWYNDAENQTNSVAWTVYQTEWGGTVLFTSTVSGENEIFFQYQNNNMTNMTVYSGMLINHQTAGSSNIEFGKIIRKTYDAIRSRMDRIREDFGQQAINWFITLLIGMLALMATIRTASMQSFVIIAFAAIFTLFGWFTMSWAALALATIISLISLLKKEDIRGG